MPILYYLGPEDFHRIETPAVAQFTRADDEPHPYAHVDQEAAEAIARVSPDLYAIKGALPGSVATNGHIHALTTGTTPAPVPLDDPNVILRKADGEVLQGPAVLEHLTARAAETKPSTRRKPTK